MNVLPPERSEHLEARVTDFLIRLALLVMLVISAVALVRPFLPIALWAIVLAVALSPIHQWMASFLGGRRGLAAVLLTLVALMVIIGPVATLTRSFIETAQEIVAGVHGGSLQLPPPPARLSSLPVVGERIEASWTLASTNIEAALDRHRQVLAPFGVGLLSLLSAISFDLLKFVLAIVVAGVLLVRGPALANGGRLIATRVIAPRGAQFVDLAGATIRNVSRGIVGVALLQSVLIGVVLQVAAVPSAGILAFAVLVLCIVQIGPVLVVLPVLVWAWLTMTTGEALLLTIVLVLLSLMDNVLKPILMSRGLSTPTLVIFLGVIGGTLSLGLLGLFLGPVVLAVFYDFLLSWLLLEPPAGPDDEAPPA